MLVRHVAGHVCVWWQWVGRGGLWGLGGRTTDEVCRSTRSMIRRKTHEPSPTHYQTAMLLRCCEECWAGPVGAWGTRRAACGERKEPDSESSQPVFPRTISLG